MSSGSAFSTPRLDPDEQQASASARHAAPDSSPSASHAAASSTGETPDPYGAAEPASPDPTAEPSRAVGETGGYRPLISFRSEQPPEPAEPEETSAARGYRSSYEETRAELARLMSVLESGSLPADSLPESVGDSPSPSGSNPPPTADVADASEPSSGSRSADSSTEPAESSAGTGGESSPWAGGRWSFAPVGESASLPTPTRPGDDYAHHASASIPNPPEPDEVPEPRRRPEVPDPGEPDPIPPAPPDPGPIPPDEPGPPPPSDSDTTTGTGTTGFSTGGAGRRERSSGSSTIAGLLAEAFAAYQETSPDDESSRQATGDTEASSFDRLFDWRYQSPESGRHRSPE
ncbi:MAG TPA: hypothetical protein VHH15_08930 [Actinophytocola sp.]|nr:hypothetical protein [Actinophytocola sp.]